MEKTFKLSNFTIKLLACIFMTIDHIGLLLDMYYGSINNGIAMLAYVFRIIGRLAYPLFFFLAIEGARKTNNFLMYLVRLGTCLVVVALAIILIQFAILPSNGYELNYLFNIFTTLICVVVIYYLLMRVNKWYLKLLILIPIFLLLFTALYEFGVIYFTNETFEKVIMSVLPDYSIFTLMVLVFFFIPHYILNYRINKTFKIIESEKENYTDEEFNTYLDKKEYYQIGSLKSSMSISIVISCFICYFLTYVEGLNSRIYSLFILTTYAVLSIVFILLYNGKLGYSNKIIKYGFYAYYPVHLLVLFGLFSLISLI